MILLRRGRQASPVGSSLDFDITFDLSPALRQRQECFAPWRPPIEVFETDAELVVRAEIGGLTGDAVSVEVTGDEIAIRGDRSMARPLNPRLYHESRVRYGPFEATVRLPFPVDVSAAGADYVDGFLTVRLPRQEATKVKPRQAGSSTIAQRGGQ